MSGRCFGYARVSTDDQDLSLQIDALTKHGIAKSDIFTDKLSGARNDRPGLAKCLAILQGGDILVVWRLDRLGRSMRYLITVVENLRDSGIGFRSLSEGAIDTTTASGELIFNIFSALAQFERRLIQERTKAGLAAARARGRHGGRPRLNSERAKVLAAKKLYTETKRYRLTTSARRSASPDRPIIATSRWTKMIQGNSLARINLGHVF